MSNFKPKQLMGSKASPHLNLLNSIVLARPVILNPLPGWLGLKNQPFLTLYLRKIFFLAVKKKLVKKEHFSRSWLSIGCQAMLSITQGGNTQLMWRQYTGIYVR